MIRFCLSGVRYRDGNGGTHIVGPGEQLKEDELEDLNMIAQLSVYPIGEGTSVGRFVRKGVKVIEESGYTYETGGMSTVIEVPDLDTLFDLVKKVHAAHVEEGARRVTIDLKVDDRRDKNATIETKKTSAKKF